MVWYYCVVADCCVVHFAIFIPKPGLLDQASPAVFFGGVGAATGGAMGAMGQFGSVSLALGAVGPSGVFAGLGKKFGLTRFLTPTTNPLKTPGNTQGDQ